MNFSNPILAIAVTLAIAALAPSAKADWELTTDAGTPDTPDVATAACYIQIPPDSGGGSFLNSYAYAYAQSSGVYASGSGSADDSTVNCDVRVQNNATAYKLIALTFTPDEPGQAGWACVEVEVKAEAEVTLRNANTAAVAVGYSLVSSNLCNQVTAKLVESAAETSSSLLANISVPIQGFKVSFPVTVSTGTGDFPDSDASATAGQMCTNFVTVNHKCRSRMEFYADEVIWRAECKGWMWAESESWLALSVCPE
jgi:hypothetical protein